MSDAVTLSHVDILFGTGIEKRKSQALSLLDTGAGRDEILAETGVTVGVADATLTLKTGEILVLMGLSGSGKSTLLRAVNGLAPVARGEIRVATASGPIDPYRASQKQLRQLRLDAVSMVFQQFALLPWRNVRDNIGFGLELAGMAKAERDARIDEQLQLVGLDGLGERPLHALSGGQQQRVGLARAFATGAPVLLMDEPFSALDPLIRTRLQDELLQLQARLNRSILFVSHDLDEAFRLGNRIAILDAGRIVQIGTPQEIMRAPASDYVAEFTRNIDPLAVLTALDVMRPGIDATAGASQLAATARADTPLAQIVEVLSQQSGTIAVIDRGTIVGSIAARDVLAALARPHHLDRHR